MIKFLKKLDKKLEITWRDTAFAIINLFNTEKKVDDIDWLHMSENIKQDKNKKWAM